MIAWLTDTLVMTGAIMALILLVRRPVGRWFGPGAAYALWALPMIRLVLPPLVLPESLAATRATEALVPSHAAEQVVPASADAMSMAAFGASEAQVAFQVPWMAIMLTVWLGGAAVFLLHRVVAYRLMRRELLRDAREIGHAGKVRIVDSPWVDAPVAFGVFDRVVALPKGFLATAESDVSDFAIAHELEHHAGNDLIANIAVQPLFALHWFNPLAWMAWRALRSDQEAACDARVMSGRSRRERERYGRLIASFAAGPRFALAAPMAGPIKGDKPIIHRLKALVRNEVPERNRVIGRSLFAASVIAVPMTATVTYAAVEAPDAGEAPPAPGGGGSHPHVPEEHAGLDAEGRIATPQVLKQKLATGTGADEEYPEGETAKDRTASPEGQAVRSLVATPVSEAQIERAVARAADEARIAAVVERRAWFVAQDAERLAQEAMSRAPKVTQSASADGRIQTISIVTPANVHRARIVRRIVLDSTCPAGTTARATKSRAVAESRVCTGVPNTTGKVAMAFRAARDATASNPRIPAELRSEIVSDLERDIEEARAELN